MLPSLVGKVARMEPFEERLSDGTANFLKNVKYSICRIARFVGWSANRWAGWLGGHSAS